MIKIEKRMRSEMNLTEGNLFIKTIVYVLPLMMTTIFQLLYTTVDLWTVSEYGGGPLSMTAIGSNGALINLIITVLVSLATGANVCLSIAKGAKDKEKAERVLHTAFVIAFFGGIVFGLIGWIFCPQLLRLMDTPDSIIDKSIEYLRIYFIGVPLSMTYNFGSQMIRALGDSKRPLYILIISGIVNVIFDVLFVKAFKMDVRGVAIATLISQGISALLVILWFKYSNTVYVNFSFKNFRIYKEEFKDIMKIGIPAGLQGLAFCIPNVLIQSSLYSIENYYIDGTLITQNEIISGSSASQQVEGYIFCMLDAFAVAVVSMAGQNLGARNSKNVRKCYWYCVIWMMIFWVICLLVVLIIPFKLLGIFITESSDINVESALLAGRERLFLMTFTYFLDGLMDIDGQYLKGIKKAIPPAIITIIGCSGTRILFLLTIFKMPYFHTIFWLYAAFPISWSLVCLTYIPVILYSEKKQFKALGI